MRSSSEVSSSSLTPFPSLAVVAVLCVLDRALLGPGLGPAVDV